MVNLHPQEQEAAFVAQLTQHQLALQHYIRSLLPGEKLVADVVQQANAKIWEKRTDFQPGTNFKAWVFSIARYEVLNHRKQQVRESRLIFSAELEQVIESELAAEDNGLILKQDALRECLKKMRQQDQQLLLQRYASSETLQEYANSIGRSLNGLRVRLHRLRTALQLCIQQRMNRSEVLS
ncbi:MAG: sigma-70 family RNA polymerase sigma factor [Planctomycetaceae bacterium]|nr:sigma-70 family RNA polymerase sigma factor [Planctomycetaceae bacterium]